MILKAANEAKENKGEERINLKKKENSIRYQSRKIKDLIEKQEKERETVPIVHEMGVLEKRTRNILIKLTWITSLIPSSKSMLC